MATIDIQVPDIGDFDEVDVIEVLVKVGDRVKVEQSLVTVESDKASMEIPSSHAGTVREIKTSLGAKVKQGTVIVTLDASEAAPASAPTTAPAPDPAPAKAGTAEPEAKAQSKPVAGAPASAGPVEVRVPDIGDFKDVAVIEILAKAGDSIKLEQSLITVESDKASMEIPSSVEGTLKEWRVKIGDKLNIGDVVALLETATGAGIAAGAVTPPQVVAADPQAKEAQSEEAPAKEAPAKEGPALEPSASDPLPTHQPKAPSAGLPHASPSVRKFARELGLPLDEVKGSGPKGRITVEDLQGFSRAVMAGSTATRAQAAKGSAAAGGASGEALGLLPWPKVDFSKFGAVERKDLSRIKKITAANLHRNWVMIPHVTNHDDADITELEAFRVQMNKENEKAGLKITMLAFLIKACVAALKKFPEFNSSLDGEQLVLKQYFNIAFAADTPNGLVVPVIRDADSKGVIQISTEMAELAKKAREGKLTPADMSGACFTISSLGGIGGRYFTPIINAPEVAILGVCRSQTEPVWDGKAFVPRLMLPLSLSWDHRVIDGAAAARFNVYLAQILGDFRRVLL